MSTVKDTDEVLCRAIVRERAENLREHRLVEYILLDEVRFTYRELLHEKLQAVKLTQRRRKILNLAFGLSGETVHTRQEIANILKITTGGVDTQRIEALGKLGSKMIEFKEEGKTQWLSLREFLHKFFVPKDAPS